MSARHHDVVSLLPAMLRYARSLTRDDTAAEDLVHDALVAALAADAGFDPARPLRPWLFGIVHNRFVSDLRRARVRSDHAAAAVVPAVADCAPQELAVALADADAAFGRLPAEQREVLHLIAVEGLSYQDTAEALAVPIGTVMSRLARARQRMREERPATAPSHLRVVRRERDQP